MRISLSGWSTDVKPTTDIEGGSVYHEHDTGETYYFSNGQWTRRTGANKIYLWNPETLCWEASTKGSGAGQAVSVENFPAVISGASVPVNDANVITILNSILSKITGLVFVIELGSFVATIE